MPASAEEIQECKDAFNLFDALIVIISLVELFIIPPSFIKEPADEGGAGGGISALRSFRLFRVFKLAQQWKSMKKLLDLIVRRTQRTSFQLESPPSLCLLPASGFPTYSPAAAGLLSASPSLRSPTSPGLLQPPVKTNENLLNLKINENQKPNNEHQ